MSKSIEDFRQVNKNPKIILVFFKGGQHTLHDEFRYLPESQTILEIMYHFV